MTGFDLFTSQFVIQQSGARDAAQKRLGALDEIPEAIHNDSKEQEKQTVRKVISPPPKKVESLEVEKT